MEAAADVIAHPAERHRAQRARAPCRAPRLAGPRVLAQQEQQLGRPRKLRRVAEAAVARIERLPELCDVRCERLGARHGSRPRRAARSLRSCVVSASADCLHLRRGRLATPARSPQDVDEPGRPHRDVGGK